MRLLQFFRSIREEKGATAVVVAISMAFLLGMTGLALDYGAMASQKQNMQNAADAAALAAAQDVGAGTYRQVAIDTANNYTAINGYENGVDTVLVDVFIQGYTVTVTISREVKMGFSAVITGVNRRRVSAQATAEAVSIFGGCPYAMFAGQKLDDGGSGISGNGNDLYIDGNIHSNSDIRMPHAVLSEGSVATAVHNVSPKQAGWRDGCIAEDMPMAGPLRKDIIGMPELAHFHGNVIKKSKTGFQELLAESLYKYQIQMGMANTEYRTKGLFIYVEGDLTFRGNNSTAYNAEFPITIVVKGNIDLNGATLNSNPSYPIVVVSEKGDITVNGGGAEFSGILFAPQGNITINGNNANFNGSLIANNITKNGGKLHVKYTDEVDNFLPRSKVHLIN